MNHLLGAPLKGRPLGLPTNIRLGWNGFPGTNALTYYEKSYLTAVKNCYKIDPRMDLLLKRVKNWKKNEDSNKKRPKMAQKWSKKPKMFPNFFLKYFIPKYFSFCDSVSRSGPDVIKLFTEAIYDFL